ncbi:MAG: DUF4922 domain-containing protein [Caldiserica bacterium]|nr:DUF4922 domain-containing protein [Caldisericota bacterium]
MGFVSTTYQIIKKLEDNERTKIINVILKLRGSVLTAYIFPRWRRLPDNYVKHFGHPDKTIKPGSSEMAGFIVAVDRDIYDFSNLETVWEALDSISSTHEDLQFLYQELTKEMDTTPERLSAPLENIEAKIDELWEKGIENKFVREECLRDIESKVYRDGLIEVQFNPHRKSIVSKARVEKRSRGKELCPYCIQEPGREDYFWNNYVISANPYPYYDHHIVIVNSEHVAQYIDEEALKVMAEFVLSSPHYFSVYNGPPGTSILSHMHFQAGIYTFPVEKAKKEILNEKDNLRVSRLLDFPTRGIVVEEEIDKMRSALCPEGRRP